MKILSMGNFLSNLSILPSIEKMLKKEKVDVIVFTGNILSAGHIYNEYLNSKKNKKRPKKHLDFIKQEIQNNKNIIFQFLKVMETSNCPTIIIPGEFDIPLDIYKTTFYKLKENIFNLNLKSLNLYNFIFLGCGGKIVKNDADKEIFFRLSFPFNEVKYKLRRHKYIINDKILITHTPPYSNKNLNINNHFTNELLKEFSPVILITSTTSSPSIDFIDKTWIIESGNLDKNTYTIFNYKTSSFLTKSFT